MHVRRQASKFAEELRAFYAVHSPESIPKAPALAREYLGRERELNEALMRKYGQDLTTVAAQVRRGSVQRDRLVRDSIN